MAPFTAGKHGFGDLLYRQVRVTVRLAAEGGAEDEQSAVRSYFVAQLLKLFMGQAGCGDSLFGLSLGSDYLWATP